MNKDDLERALRIYKKRYADAALAGDEPKCKIITDAIEVTQHELAQLSAKEAEPK